MSQQKSTEIKCTDCGKTAVVPFKPTVDKPVYCSECLAKHRTNQTQTPRKDMQSKTNVKIHTDGEKQAWSRRRNNWK